VFFVNKRLAAEAAAQAARSKAWKEQRLAEMAAGRG